MSRIDDLIEKHVPHGVEYQLLGDLMTYTRGITYAKMQETSGPDGCGLLRSNNIDLTSNSLDLTDVKRVRKEVRIRADQWLRVGDILISAASGSKAHVGKVAYIAEELGLSFGGFMAVVRANEKLDSRYLFHVLSGRAFADYLDRAITSTTINNLSAKVMGAFQLPAPPIEIQREIVRILDTFAAMTSSLQDEIALRREQYAAISRRLFMQAAAGTDGHSVARVRIGEVAKQCARHEVLEPEEEYECLGVKWYGAGAYLRETRLGGEIKAKTLKRVKAGQFLYNRMFVTEGSFAVVSPEFDGGVVSNEFPIYDLDESRVLPGWLLLSVLDEFALKRIEAETTGVERGSMKSRRRWKEDRFEAFMIDLPSVEVQGRVLQTLDVLKTFQESLDEELQARRQQHAYYRDRLLMFEEAAA